jgi:hypothetical protein
MTDKTPSELHEEYERCKRHYESLLEDYGLVARTLMPGQRLETPKKSVTPEGLEAIQDAERQANEAWERYQHSLR